MASDEENGGTMQKSAGKVGIMDRIEHFTWAWYTLTMSTGGLALLLGGQPHKFPGLMTIGKVVYIFDLVLFACISTAITIRFVHFPGTLRNSLTHKTESLMFPTAALSLASIIAAMATYGIPAAGHWLVVVYIVLFWLYFALTFLSAVAQYYYLFSRPQYTIQGMVPSWILPIFPFMLCGTISSSGAASMRPEQALPVIVGGLTAQGLGMLVAFLFYAQYIRRLLEFGLPSDNMRPGMFISVGPPAFTSLAIIGLANDFPAGQAFFGDPAITQQVVKIMATFTAVFLWCLAFWFFCLSAVACIGAARSMCFHLSWWSFVFPNVGFTIATIRIGEMVQSQGVQWVGSAMTILLVITYLFVLFSHARAVWRKDILFPGKDEDAQHTDPAKQRSQEEEAKLHKAN